MSHPTLTTTERDVMAVLAEGRTTISVVALAADLYGRDNKDERFTFGDPIGFVTWLLKGLNERELVVYRIQSRSGEDAPAFAGLPYHIRLTPKGWAEMGYAHRVIEVGTFGRHRREVNTVDRTDYRNHQRIAEGGLIDRHWYWECPLLRKEPALAEQELILRDMTRTYIRVTPEMEERVLSSYGRTGSYEKTAKEVNLDERRVRYIVHDRPRLRRDSSSLKERALALITENGPYVDALALYKDMPGPHGLHNLIHVLHSLNKAQLIEFRTDRTGASTNYLAIRVRAEKAKPDGGTKLAPTSEAQQDSLYERESPAGPERPSESKLGESKLAAFDYPELARLIVLEGETAEARAKASQYLAAAEAVADIDPGMSEELMRRAGDVDGASLSPVESEYLRYAKANPVA